MRLARFAIDDKARVGVAADGAWLELGVTWTDALMASAQAQDLLGLATGQRWDTEEIELLAPLEESGRGIFCIGMNYAPHAEEAAPSLGGGAQRPAVFLKLAASVAPPGQPITLDETVSREFDWEVELGVVIGRGGRSIRPEQVHEHIAGYTIVNDISARDLQRDHVQWFMGKNVDRSSPVGPWVVTADEIAFPPVLTVTLSIDGVEKQRDTTDRLIWTVEQFISMVSGCVELLPGDVFATGTPAGVGFSREPAEFLRRGNQVRAEVEKVGVLTNVVQ